MDPTLKKPERQKLRLVMSTLRDLGLEEGVLTSSEQNIMNSEVDHADLSAWRLSFKTVALKLEVALISELAVGYDSLSKQIIDRGLGISMKKCVRVGSGRSISTISSRISELHSVRRQIEEKLNGASSSSKKRKMD